MESTKTATTAATTKQPRQLYILFFAELWERFSFYGMRALLVLYMTSQYLYNDTRSYSVYAAYGALVYGTQFLGGVIADRLLGFKKAIVLGGLLIAAGHFTMTLPSEMFFYLGLAFIITGTGFFKPNISSTVGGLYTPGDPRRDAGFTIFYMGINTGGAIAPLLCGYIGQTYGWHYGFGLAGVGMLLGLIVFLRGKASLGLVGDPPNPEVLQKTYLGIRLEYLIYAGSFIVTPLFAMLVFNHELMTPVLVPFGLFVLIVLLVEAFRSDKVERERIFAMLTLIFFSIMFWAFFEQAGSSITLFTERNVDRTVFGYTIPTSVFQSVNSAFIILCAPFFAALWIRLGRAGKEPSTPFKFGIGIIQLGLGFGAFVLGTMFADEAGYVPLIFLFMGYFLHTTGELCLSPVGLSMITKLSPKRIVASSMGAWFLAVAFAHHIGGFVASLTATGSVEETQEADSAVQTLGIYSDVFWAVALTAIGSGVLLLLLIPLLKKWMHGIR